jgi:PEP-CTERM motif
MRKLDFDRIGARAKRPIITMMVLMSAQLALPAVAPAATYLGEANIQSGHYMTNRGTTSDPASYTLSANGGYASTTMTARHGGTVQSYVSSNGIFDGFSTGTQATATGFITYTFMVVGPQYSVVPVRVQGTGWAKGDGVFNASASLIVNDITGDGYMSTGANEQQKSGAFTFDMVLYFYSNSAYQVRMETNVQAGPWWSSGPVGSSSGWASAYVDPVFTIDPAYASQFTLVGIPQEATAVPEPSAWALMIAGFAMLGSALRARRRSLIRVPALC